MVSHLIDCVMFVINCNNQSIGVCMAIRTRIKSFIKRTILSQSTPSTSKNVTPDPFPKSEKRTSPSFTAPTPTSTVTANESPSKDAASVQTASSTEDSKPNPNLTNESNPNPPATSESTISEVSTSDIQDNAQDDAKEGISQTDKANAAYIVNVVNIFPESCPNCGASSFGNWIRIDNKFACGPCNSVY